MNVVLKTDLKPCPFCGGNATFHIYGGRSCNVLCDDCRIGTRLEHIDEYEVAVSAWNTRPDRTCKEVLIDKHWRDCSACGYKWEFMYGIGKCKMPVFCPDCGAKVVE